MTDQHAVAPVAPSFREAGRAAMVGRTTVIVAGLASAALLPLALAPAEVGLFFLAVSVSAGLATVGQLGLTLVGPAVLTDAIARPDLAGARRLVVTMVLVCLVAGGVVGTATTLVGPVLAGALDSPAATGLWGVLALVALLAVVTGLAAVVSELLRATHAVRSAATLTAVASTPAALYALGALALPGEATVTGVLTACVAGAGATLVVGLVVLWRRTSDWRTAGGTSGPGLRPLLARAFPVMLTTLVLFLLATADLWILSAVGTFDEVAHYGLALRCATVVLVPLGIANGAAAPLVVHARVAGTPEELGSIVDGVVRNGVGAALALYAAFALTGYWLIRAWNADYLEVYGLGLILCLGAVLHACGGAAGVLLMVWGDQRGALLLTLVSGGATLGLCVLGYAALGVTGLALAAASGSAAQALLFVLRVRSRFGIDPSVLRLRGSLLRAR